MLTFQLTPTNGRASFGGKAYVKEENGYAELFSYHTKVATYCRRTGKVTYTSNKSHLSNTTMSHIKSFQAYYGLEQLTKKQIIDSQP